MTARSMNKLIVVALLAIGICFAPLGAFGEIVGVAAHESNLVAAFTLTPTKFQPTKSPSKSRPTLSPTVSHPTKSPATSRPSKAPTTSRPTKAPTPPTYSPTRSPTISRPTKSPVTSRPSKAPITSRPTLSPVIGPCERYSKNPTLCALSLADCAWVTKVVCPYLGAPAAKCKTFTYGCHSQNQPYCAYTGGNTKQKLTQCVSNPNCYWAGKMGCQINWGVDFSRSPTNKPTTLEPTTMQPTTLKPTTLHPTSSAPTSKSPTSKAPTTKKPTTPKPTYATGNANCYDACSFNFDGECDDGRAGASTGLCYPGSDCTDCGPLP